ncbi:MAG TPA: RraA family protein [Candidatus Thermoplasmatota archaeon]|nr:RraA family protein [Candidatus Thermoplasmatota archaeon]
MPDPRLAKVRASSLSDAMRKLHPHRHHVLDLVSPTPDRVLFGPAATMLFAPVRADVPKEAQSFDAHLARIARPGAVLVCASPGAERAAAVGGIRLTRAAALGFSGVLTTARIRDFREAAASPLTVYCRGETPLAGSSEAMPVATDIPLALDDATVLPGDFVYADDAGAVILPAKDVDRALELAAQIEAQDVERAKAAAR